MKIKPITAAIGLAGFFAALYGFGGTPAYAEAAAQTTASEQKVQETVDSGDTLSGIASEHQTTYVRIYDANEQIENPDVIHPGEVLRIPLPDEQLTSRPLPEGTASQAVVVAAVPAPVASSIARQSAPGVAADGSVWDKLAICESGGNWAINTGNGFYGGLQFTKSSWEGVGGSGMPHQASREQQIAMAEKLLARQGWGAWPACSSKLGLR